MKEKIDIYYGTSEPFNYFNEIFTIQFFNSMYAVVLTTAENHYERGREPAPSSSPPS
jgi:hypothetical protein